MSAARERCLHCERRPSRTGLGLCLACHASEGTRALYVRKRDRPPEWERHLRRLTARAQARLPLFDGPRRERAG
jgi:hypothetical protein